MLNQNGNGTASPPRVERGKSVAHRQDTKQQRAAKAAFVADGLVPYQPTQVELARSYQVSVTLINRARRLPPDQRKRVAQGRARLPHPNHTLVLPKLNGNGTEIPDSELVSIAQRVGADRMLAAAVAAGH
jgi:hypothetical protein